MIKAAFKKLEDYIENGGPNINDYNEVDKIWDILPKNFLKYKEIVQYNETRNVDLPHEFLKGTLVGFAYHKPHGYAGDFEIIDTIHTKKVSGNIQFEKWDPICSNNLPQ